MLCRLLPPPPPAASSSRSFLTPCTPAASSRRRSCPSRYHLSGHHPSRARPEPRPTRPAPTRPAPTRGVGLPQLESDVVGSSPAAPVWPLGVCGEAPSSATPSPLEGASVGGGVVEPKAVNLGHACMKTLEGPKHPPLEPSDPPSPPEPRRVRGVRVQSVASRFFLI